MKIQISCIATDEKKLVNIKSETPCPKKVKPSKAQFFCIVVRCVYNNATINNTFFTIEQDLKSYLCGHSLINKGIILFNLCFYSLAF